MGTNKEIKSVGGNHGSAAVSDETSRKVLKSNDYSIHEFMFPR
jgi:hypothetical protein